MEYLQNNLKEIRMEKNLTKAEVSNILKIHPQTWHKYESGIQNMSLETFAKFCEKLDVSADYLLGLTNENSRSLITQFYCRVIDIICEYEEMQLLEEKYIDHLINEINELYKNLKLFTLKSETKGKYDA